MVIIAAPIWADGVKGSTVAGVFYLVPTQTFLNDIVANIKISEGATAQIINKMGTAVAHPEMGFEIATETSAPLARDRWRD